MYREYEIFEVLQNGTSSLSRRVSGLEPAKAALDTLAGTTRNECFVADTKTRQVVAQRNVPPPKWRSAKRVFQIGYQDAMATTRAELLRRRGYGIISVVGNDAAKVLLSSIQHYDLFIVGHAAPERTRREMVDWLKAKYPSVRVLALNPPAEQLPNADYNIPLNDAPETWLPIVAQQ